MTTISVMGATGRTGGSIAQRLLARDVHVRALARSDERLRPLTAQGAEALAGDAADAVYLTRAFRGADAVYALMPHDPAEPGYLRQQQRQGEAMADALRASGVRRVVMLSSIGADQPAGTGVIQSLYEQEQRLRAIDGLNVLFLRPGAFFDTYHASLPVIRSAGVLADALAPDQAVPMVATRDIAAVAADALLAHDWQGIVVRELCGPRDMTSREIARILGARLGLPDLQYVQVPYDEMTQTLVEAGMAPDAAALIVEMARGMNEGRVRSTQPRDERRTLPTSFEEFSQELAEAYSRV